MIICLGFHICVGLLVRQFQRAHSEAVLRLEKKKEKKREKKNGEKNQLGNSLKEARGGGNTKYLRLKTCFQEYRYQYYKQKYDNKQHRTTRHRTTGPPP